MDLCFTEVLGIEEKFWGEGIVALRGQQKLQGGNSPGLECQEKGELFQTGKGEHGWDIGEEFLAG